MLTYNDPTLSFTFLRIISPGFHWVFTVCCQSNATVLLDLSLGQQLTQSSFIQHILYLERLRKYVKDQKGKFQFHLFIYKMAIVVSIFGQLLDVSLRLLCNPFLCFDDNTRTSLVIYCSHHSAGFIFIKLSVYYGWWGCNQIKSTRSLADFEDLLL